MGAVKNQHGLGMPDRLSTRYGGVPVIYVESDEDSYVFGECWFKDRLSRVEFKPASDQQQGFSGCTAVVNAVTVERKSGNLAWGIVDRDTVMKDDLWPLVHETDDDAYERAKPFGPEVKALCRWEMENYLANGEALEKCRAESKMQAERPAQIVYEELLDHCQALVPHAAANALFHKYKVRGLKDGFTELLSRDDVDSRIRSTQLPRKLPQTPVTEYGQQVANVDAFDIPNADVPQRVNSLLRRVHGKALLARFAKTNNIAGNMKGQLANRIKEMSLVPEEIAAFVDAVTSDY